MRRWCRARSQGNVGLDRGGLSQRRAGHDVTVGVDHARDAVRRRDQHPPARLDGPQARDRPLLRRLGGAGEGGVAGLHHEDLGVVVDRLADHPVVGDVVADRVADADAVDRECPCLPTRDHVPRDVTVDPGHQAAEGVSEGHVLPVGHGLALDVLVPGPVRGPDDPRVLDRVGGRTVQEAADQDRGTQVLGESIELRTLRVAVAGVGVRRVLGPEHDVGRLRLTRLDAIDEPLRLLDVQLQDGSPRPLQELPRRVALNQGEPCGVRAGRS